MPPGRPRRTTTQPTRNAHHQKQPTLSFNSKPTRVTKPTVSENAGNNKTVGKLEQQGQQQQRQQSVVLEKEEQQEEQQEEEGKATQTAAKEDVSLTVTAPELGAGGSRSQQVHKTNERKEEEEKEKPKDEIVLRAEKVTDAQIKKYWKREEDGRKAARVHQQTLPLDERILRHFDLCSQFGPCIGIPRIKRWRRAQVLGLNPPIEVMAVLVRMEEVEKEKKKKEKQKQVGEGKGVAVAGVGAVGEVGAKAYVDELLG